MRKEKEITEKDIKKTIKKGIKQQKDCFKPWTVSLQKWCTAYGVPNHFEWIRRLIFAELEEDETLGDYIRLDEDLYDIYLDDKGIYLFSHILQDFFGLEQVRDMWKYAERKNELYGIAFYLPKYITTYTYDQLNECEKAWAELKSVEHNDEELKTIVQKILSCIHKEQERRFYSIEKI